MADVDLDTSGFVTLAREFRSAAVEAPAEAKKVVDKGLLNIKKGMQKRWRGHRSIKGLPPSISYESRRYGSRTVGEVGPVVGRRQGSLAGLIEGGNLEYGTLRNAPIPAAKPEAEREAPRFEQALQDLGERLAGGDR